MQRLKGECSYNPDIDLDCVDVESEERDDELSDYVVEEPDWIPTPVCLPSDDGSDEEESVEEEEDVEDEEDEVIVFPAGENFFYSAELFAMVDRQLAAMRASMYNTANDGDEEDEAEKEVLAKRYGMRVEIDVKEKPF